MGIVTQFIKEKHTNSVNLCYYLFIDEKYTLKDSIFWLIELLTIDLSICSSTEDDSNPETFLPFSSIFPLQEQVPSQLVSHSIGIW